MFAKPCKNLKKVFAYTIETDQDENNADLKELHKMAAKEGTKVAVFGGLHGIDQTGVPSGQTPKEKENVWANEAFVTINGVKITSFALNDVAMKKSGIDFVYTNLAKYTTKGSDMTLERQLELKTKIQDYHRGGYYVMLSWCFSKVWAEGMGL